MMSSSTGRERILLLLQNFSNIEKRKEVPYHTSQAGISKAVNLSQTRVSRLMKEMAEEKLVKELKKHVRGLKRRRKVYSLTHPGERRAEEVRGEKIEDKVTIKTDSGEEKIELEAIDNHLDSSYPVVEALARLEEKRVIDTTEVKKEKEERCSDKLSVIWLRTGIPR